MLICGMKLTHDGCVAVIDDNRLLFNIEIEKLGNNPRYSKIPDLAMVSEILRHGNLKPSDIDLWAVDGWFGRESGTVETIVNEHPLTLRVAGYRETDLKGDPGGVTVNGTVDLAGYEISYLSGPHVAGHWAGAYWASPFAKTGESADALVWDGGSFPRMYRIAGDTVTALGEAFPLFGHIYALAGFRFGPYIRGSQPGELWVAGKLMAYIAKGQVVPAVIDVLDSAFQDHFSGPSPRATRYREEVGGFGSLVEPSRKTAEDFLADARERLAPLRVHDDDVLTSFHHFLESKLISEVMKLLSRNGGYSDNLVFAGGCALNIKWNSALRERGPWQRVWVPPFCNDTGSAIGAALLAARHVTDPGSLRALEWSARSGPALSRPVVRKGWIRRPCSPARLARLLYETGEPVVILNGRAELGPRALGGRSILAPATDSTMKARLNAIKSREDYRPVAPVCLEHLASDVFDPGTPDPYMLFDHTIRPDWYGRIPAVAHLDGTARLQTVSQEDDLVLFEILSEYHRLSGIPVLCNTSANHEGRGFFPGIQSAMDWGKILNIWSEGYWYQRS